MVDIGFKNSSNSDRNEGPPPPPDWNLIVVDFPPPPPSFDVPVKFPMCFETTLTFLAIKVSKDGSWSVDYPQNVPIRGWGIYGKPPGHRLNPISFPGAGGPPVTKLPPGMGKDKYNSMEHAIKELQRKIGGRGIDNADSLNSDWLCHIIKLCICCPNSFEWSLFQGYLRTLAPKIVDTAMNLSKTGGWHKVLSDSDGDWWIYLSFTFKPSCEGCRSKECRCVRVKQIDLTDKGDIKSSQGDASERTRIRRGPPQPDRTPTFIYTDSNFNEHVIPASGDESFKEVIKKILEIEDEEFDCK